MKISSPHPHTKQREDSCMVPWFNLGKAAWRGVSEIASKLFRNSKMGIPKVS